MKDFIELLKREWEITALACVVLALGGWGVFVLLGGDGRRMSSDAVLGGWEKDGLVTDSTMAFVKQREPLEMLTERPFALPEVMRQRPPAPKPKPQPAPKPAPKPVAPPPEPAPAPAPVAAAPQPPPVVKPKPVVKEPKIIGGKLYYAEVQEMADGSRAALLELTRGQEQLTLALARGETKHGIQVVNVTDQAVYLYDAKKRQVRIKREGEVQAWVHDD